MSTRVLYARVDDDVHAELVRLAGELGLPMRAVVNIALRAALKLPMHTATQRVHALILAQLGNASGESPSASGQ